MVVEQEREAGKGQRKTHGCSTWERKPLGAIDTDLRFRRSGGKKFSDSGGKKIEVTAEWWAGKLRG